MGGPIPLNATDVFEVGCLLFEDMCVEVLQLRLPVPFLRVTVFFCISRTGDNEMSLTLWEFMSSLERKGH